MKLPDAGTVEIVAGPMGSGKSLQSVEKVVEIITTERRPVFTNLPIKLRVLREYLRVKHGPAYASLIYTLSEDHFKNFIERQHQQMQLRKKLEDKWARRGRPLMHGRVSRIFQRIAGQPIYSGPIANDILPTSYVVIDEAHHWFPMQGGKPVDEVLQRYITMCRHHMHQVVLITQAPMQLAMSARRLASLYTICRNKANDKIVWGVRFKHLGLKSLGRETWRADDVTNGVPSQFAEPMISHAIHLQFPRAQTLFRLYSSFTHLGSPRRMMNSLNEVRRTHGIYDEDRAIRERSAIVKRERPMKIGRVVGRTIYRVSIAAIFVVIGVAVGRGMSPKAAPQADQEGVAFTVPDEMRLTARAKDRWRVGGKWYGVGDNFEGATVVAVAADGLMLDHRGVWYAYGKQGLVRVGSTDQLVPADDTATVGRAVRSRDIDRRGFSFAPTGDTRSTRSDSRP